MARFQTLPLLWLLSDERNDARLEAALRDLPEGSGFIFRHYHLESQERRTRFDTLAKIARERSHTAILSGSAEDARECGADGMYGPLERLGDVNGLLRLATAHDAAELEVANEARADGVFLSPVFPTRSHLGGTTLGAMGFHILAQQSTVPVIALGGMNAERAAELGWPRWGAIDGFS